MNKVSKKLDKVFIIEGNKEELLNFLEEIRRRDIPLISVQFPNNKEKISTSYINNNWKITKNRVEDVVFFAKAANNQYVFAFNNSKFEERFKKTVAKMHVRAERFYTQSEAEKVALVRDTYVNGKVDSVKVIARFGTNKYSVARCFA